MSRADVVMLQMTEPGSSDQDRAYAAAELYTVAVRRYGQSVMDEQVRILQQRHQWFLEGLCEFCGAQGNDDELLCKSCLDKHIRQATIGRLMGRKPPGRTN